MKKFIVLFALLAFACAAPAPASDEDDEVEKKDAIAILRSESTQGEDGSYNFGYEGSDGSAREEKADILNPDTDEAELSITGSYRYIDANGDEVLVNYTADKNGFVPVGTIIHKDITQVAAAAKDLPAYAPEERDNKVQTDDE